MIDVIKQAKLKKIDLLKLEIALYESIDKIENEGYKFIINNMETMMKDIKILYDKINEICRELNKLVEVLVKELNQL